jgi:CRP/FNR family transcriptional regulator/CRP/FNR family cyclic AMP-dependent transcriptional regulator
MLSEAAYLAPITLFSELSEDELAVVANRLKPQTFQAGALIFKQGERGDAMFIIRSGRVRVYSQGEGGQELTLSVYGKGEFVGEFSLIDGEPRSASVQAVEPTEALVLHYQDLIAILSEYPQIAISLMRGLVSRLRRTTEYAEDLAFLGVNGRVSSQLLELMQRHGVQGEAGVEIGVPVSVPQLAGLAVAPPEIVQRILDFYELGGILARTGDRVTVRDPATLRERVALYRRKRLP